MLYLLLRTTPAQKRKWRIQWMRGKEGQEGSGFVGTWPATCTVPTQISSLCKRRKSSEWWKQVPFSPQLGHSSHVEAFHEGSLSTRGLQFFLAVNSLVLYQRSFIGTSSATLGAVVGSVPQMSPLVLGKVGGVNKLFPTLRASVRLLTRVDSPVHGQMSPLGKALSALTAAVLFLARVGSLVYSQRWWPPEPFSTLSAQICTVSAGRPRMGLEPLGPHMSFCILFLLHMLFSFDGGSLMPCQGR